MATATFKTTGDTIDYPAASAVVDGEVLTIGRIVGVVVRGVTAADIAAGRKAALQIEGIFEMPKTAPLAISQGDACFWNDSADKITKTTTDVFCGFCTEDAASAATVVKVRLQAAAVDLT
jgi:predicted RecA/RadA family phage recombinase